MKLNLPSLPEIMCDLCVSDMHLIRFARGVVLILSKEWRREELTRVQSSWDVKVTQNAGLLGTHNKALQPMPLGVGAGWPAVRRVVRLSLVIQGKGSYLEFGP